MVKPRWIDEKFWLVKFPRKSKSFSIKKYKTKEAALEAAHIWRKEYSEEISYVGKMVNPRWIENKFWVVEFKTSGKRKKKRFCVKKYKNSE